MNPPLEFPHSRLRLQRSDHVFCEYAYVLEHTCRLVRLEKLWWITLQEADVRQLVTHLCDEVGVEVARVAFLLDLSSGKYEPRGSLVMLPCEARTVGLVIHETAHHVVAHTDRKIDPGEDFMGHGGDFVSALDRLVDHAWDALGLDELTGEEWAWLIPVPSQVLVGAD